MAWGLVGVQLSLSTTEEFLSPITTPETTLSLERCCRPKLSTARCERMYPDVSLRKKSHSSTPAAFLLSSAPNEHDLFRRSVIANTKLPFFFFFFSSLHSLSHIENVTKGAGSLSAWCVCFQVWATGAKAVSADKRTNKYEMMWEPFFTFFFSWMKMERRLIVLHTAHVVPSDRINQRSATHCGAVAAWFNQRSTPSLRIKKCRACQVLNMQNVYILLRQGAQRLFRHSHQ